MWIYILRRLLFFVPALFLVSIFAFNISSVSPVDPVERIMSESSNSNSNGLSYDESMQQRQEIREYLRLNKPSFYITLTTLASCDTLHKIPDKNVRENLEKLTHHYGNWEYVQNYYVSLKNAFNNTSRFDASRQTHQIKSLRTEIMSAYLALMQIPDKKRTLIVLSKQKERLNILGDKTLLNDLSNCRNKFSDIINHSTTWKQYIPSIRWNGITNQYHEWLFGSQVIGFAGSKGIIRGDFGTSIETGREISTHIIRKFRLSLELVVISIILAYFISIPIGLYSAYKQNRLFDKGSGVVLFLLYALPNFFVGLLLLHFFANPEHYEWFEGAGYKNPEIAYDTYYEEWGYFSRLKHSWPYMILPIVTYVYAQFAFISRLTRGSMLEQLGLDYIRTARAKGLSEWKVVVKHAFRNSLLPIITVFSNVFPMAVGGSVIVETIFDYEGLGKEMFNAINSNDYMIVVNVFTLSALMTMTGYLLADILYKVADPRIRFGKS